MNSKYPKVVYHGTIYAHLPSIKSGILIDRPDAKTNLDFGKGFYTTTSFEQANERANFLQEQRRQKNGQLDRNHRGIIITFALDQSKLYNVANDMYKEFEDADVEWAEFILDNRIRSTNHSYSWTYGPMADGRTTYLCSQFMAGRIDHNKLLNGYRLEGQHIEGLRPYKENYDQLVFHQDENVNQILTFVRIDYSTPPKITTRR